MPIAGGQLILGSDVNGIIGAPIILDTDYSHPISNTTLAATALVAAVAANSKYNLRAVLLLDASTTADFKWDFTLPAGASIPFAVTLHYESTITRQLFSSAGPYTAATIGVGSITVVVQDAVVRTAGTAGSVTLRAAQNTSDATVTKLRANSSLAVSLG